MSLQQTCIKCLTQFTGYISICNICQASEAQIKQQKKNLEAQREAQQEQNRANEQQIRDRMNWERWQRVDREQQNEAQTPREQYELPVTVSSRPYLQPKTPEQLRRLELEREREIAKEKVTEVLMMIYAWGIYMVVYNFLPFLFFGVNWWTYLTAFVIVPLTFYLNYLFE